MLFVSYLRVSTNRQGGSGLGLEAQREAVSRFLASKGSTLHAEYVEIESGKLRSRPVLTEALTHCRKDKAILVIAKLDRLARNVAFVSSLMEAKTEFVAVDAPYANRLMIHILAAFAEHEREQIAARTRDALAAAKARGVKLGVNGARLAKQRKEEALAFAEKLRPTIGELVGRNLTLAQMAEELKMRDISPRCGGEWKPMMVSRVIQRLGLTRCSNASSISSKARTTRIRDTDTQTHPNSDNSPPCCSR